MYKTGGDQHWTRQKTRKERGVTPKQRSLIETTKTPIPKTLAMWQKLNPLLRIFNTDRLWPLKKQSGGSSINLLL